jgi:TRAP transporter TAXI family solute receptor
MLRAAFFVLAACVTLRPVAAQEVEANIVTGGASGTYIQIGRDLAALGAECGLTLNVRESAGSIENMNAVRDRPATQLGVVQSDVLEYFQTFAGDDPALRRAARGIRVAFPLYNEEVHVLARREIAGLADLAGKRVATGVEGSGTRLTADLVLDLVEVAPAERVALGPAEALAALLAGEVDAFFYVVGAPAELFRSDRIDPAAFHLLPLTDPVLAAVYTPTEVAAGTYPFVTEPVKLVAVKAVLVTFDFQRERNAYQAASCGLVADVSHLILTRFDQLREQGHPKWKAVDVKDIPPGWEVSACVLEGLAPGYAFTCRKPDGTVVEEGLSGEAESEPNRLFLQRVCARMGC